MKKILALVMAVVMVFGLMSVAAAADDKVTLNIYAFTDEVPGMIQRYMDEHPEVAEKYELNVTIIPTTDGAYQPALDLALMNGEVDMFAAEAAFVLKYAQGDMSDFAAAYDDLGIDTAAAIEAAQIAQYSVDIGTRPSDGKVVGLGYQATGGAFIYRASIAEAVWGSSDPEVVAEKIGVGTGNWDAFMAAAEELKAQGYAIVSGDGDIWHAVENSSATGWLTEDELLHIDPAREAFLDLSKQLTDNEYSHQTQDWTEGWYADMKADGNVLGFYGPAWLINYVMVGNSGGEAVGEGSYGDWRVCASNIGFFWGGTWIMAGADVVGTEKQEIIADIINWITLDDSEDGLQYKWANGIGYGAKDSVASGTVMAKSNGELDFLGGQNMFDAFIPANAYANGKNLTQYDEGINTAWRDQVRAYAKGDKTRDEAIVDFKQAVNDTLAIEAE